MFDGWSKTPTSSLQQLHTYTYILHTPTHTNIHIWWVEQSSNEQASTTLFLFPLSHFMYPNKSSSKIQCGYILFFFKWVLQWVFIEIHVPSRGWRPPQRFMTTTWEGGDDQHAGPNSAWDCKRSPSHQAFMWLLGTELRPSCLCSKHVTHRTISLATACRLVFVVLELNLELSMC